MMQSRQLSRWCAFAALLLIAGIARQAVAQVCIWRGTAILCSGACGTGESEQTRARTDPGFVDNATGARIDFGGACLTGTKALCCKTPASTCSWKGTAPFCDGECTGSETQQTPPDGSSSGASCWSGSKVYCCTMKPVGSVPQRLSTCPISQTDVRVSAVRPAPPAAVKAVAAYFRLGVRHHHPRGAANVLGELLAVTSVVPRA
jgi:hypothetical protein